MRSDSFSDTTWGFADVIPQFSLRWNAGVNNFMTYVTGDIPVGAYQSTRLANLGLGHGAIDAGGGYTYFNPATGPELSAVLGFTYNFVNPSTQYQSGVDMHLDWGRVAIPDQAGAGGSGRVRLQGTGVRQRLWRPGRVLPVAGVRRRAAVRLRLSAQRRPPRVRQSQGIRGIRRGGSPDRVEQLAHICHLARSGASAPRYIA